MENTTQSTQAPTPEQSKAGRGLVKARWSKIARLGKRPAKHHLARLKIKYRTQKAVAQACNVSAMTAGRWYSGEILPPVSICDVV